MTTRIPIRYSKVWTWLLTLTAMPRGLSYIEIDGDAVKVRMSCAFRARFTRGDISSVTTRRPVVSVGVHGWRGRWLVNGAHRPIAGSRSPYPFGPGCWGSRSRCASCS